MKYLIGATMVAVVLATAPALAQGTNKGKAPGPGQSEYAPGQKQTTPGTAKDRAPGQRQSDPGTAKDYAPGQQKPPPAKTK
jgi:hypothetical protein